MITLTKNEEIERFQLEFSLLRKTNQSAFISILVLALEQDSIDAISVAANLLTGVPERACDNLLKRLARLGYLVEEPKGNMSSYCLTDELGKKCAIEKAFWVPEKGVYNVFVLKSNLVQQRIIKIDRVDKSQNEEHVQAISQLPVEVTSARNQALLLNDGEAMITELEKNGYRLDSIVCALHLEANANESTLKIQQDKEILYTTLLELEEGWVREEILKSIELYNEDKKAILTEFDKNNLSFSRDVSVKSPVIKNNKFNTVQLTHVAHLPANLINARKWYGEMLYRSIEDYFFEDAAFDQLAQEVSKPFAKHFKLQIPNKKTFALEMAKRTDAFYQLAKLETHNFLIY